MLKYIITRQRKEYISYNSTHSEIIQDNHIKHSDILDEGFIENGKNFSWYSFSEDLANKNILRAREIESIYQYKYIREGD